MDTLLEDLFKAYYTARSNKRNTRNQLKFEMNLETNLIGLYDQIRNRTYKTARGVCFIIQKPVKREIFAASFRDRVIHHLLFNYLSPLFEQTFITDNYSCRKGKGTLYGIDRLQHHIRSCTKNFTQPAYVLKLDIQGYFMNINRSILYDQIMGTLERYRCKKRPDGKSWGQVLDYKLIEFLLSEVVNNDPTKDCYIKGALSEWDGLPHTKSLFHTPAGCGLPIGNLTSQLFSNIYLNRFDQFIKRTLKEKHYGRYVDDFFIVNASKARLKQDIVIIKSYLQRELGLDIHPKKIHLQPVGNGITFLGAMVKPHRKYVANKTVRNFRASLNEHKYTPHKDVEKLTQQMNSYLGVLRHHKTFLLRKKIIEQNSWLSDYGTVKPDYLKFTPLSRKECVGEPDE